MAAKASPLFQNAPENRIALKLTHTDSAYPLRKARKIGIDLLELSFPTNIDPAVLRDFFLLLDTKQHFRTVYELQANESSILSSIQSNWNAVPSQLKDNIAAVKVLDFPADYDEQFPAIAERMLTQFSDSIDSNFYYQSAFQQPLFKTDEFDFISGRLLIKADSTAIPEIPVILFEPSDNVIESLQALEEVLNYSFSYSESIVIIPADWFFSRVDSQDSFFEIIASYLAGNTVTFPMPAAKTEYPNVNWPILFLLAIWAGFIIHYKYQPMYKASLPRYFFSHSFFVHDVMEYRIRSAVSGMIVLVMHAFLTGFFFYLASDSFVSSTGFQSLAAHFPALIYPGYETLCLFGIGTLTALTSHFISIAWLYLFNKKLKQLNQVINLYNWPLHLNLLIVTLVVYFTQLDLSSNWMIVTLIIAYFFVWFFSFNIAAIDGAKFLEKYRVLNLLLTVGIHLLLIATAIILIFLLPFIFEPLKMALMLP